MRFFFAAVPALVLPAVAAEAPDTRLDELFAALKQAKTAEIAAPIEAQIWVIWTESDSPTAALLLERVGQTQDDPALARQILDALVKIEPGFAEGWYRRSKTSFDGGDVAGALADLERTLALEPRHFGALMGVAAIFESLGQDEKALMAYEQVLALYPAFTDAKTAAEILRRKVEGQRI